MNIALKTIYFWILDNISIFNNWMSDLLFYVAANATAFTIAWFSVKKLRDIPEMRDSKMSLVAHWIIRCIALLFICIVTLIIITINWILTKAPLWTRYVFLSVSFILLVQFITTIKIWWRGDKA